MLLAQLKPKSLAGPNGVTSSTGHRQPRSGTFDVATHLRHFAIVTLAVDPEVLQRTLHPRFMVDRIRLPHGEWGLVSVVPFQDHDFHITRLGWPRWSFGQTNYRAYVIDRKTGERAVWFFGTVLDFWGVIVPRYAWRLPWHAARIRFECNYNSGLGRYDSYRMTTRSAWAPAHLELEDSGRAPEILDGFDELESGLFTLTHPLVGFYYRRDGRLGSYSVSHDRLKPTIGRVVSARFPLLENLGLVQAGDMMVHSVLIQPVTQFAIHLPPVPIDEALGESWAG
jgi:hypothetical protein